jgi:MFS superfamily sulfate permease-like transporter
VAGLPPQYGLYSAFMGCFVYTVFGSSKDITIGPTAIMALMTGAHAQYGEAYAVLLTFLTGLIIFSFGILQLGERILNMEVLGDRCKIRRFLTVKSPFLAASEPFYQ